MDYYVHEVFQERNIEGLSGKVFARATCFAPDKLQGQVSSLERWSSITGAPHGFNDHFHDGRTKSLTDVKHTIVASTVCGEIADVYTRNRLLIPATTALNTSLYTYV